MCDISDLSIDQVFAQENADARREFGEALEKYFRELSELVGNGVGNQKEAKAVGTTLP
jgi:hypothetical protein